MEEVALGEVFLRILKFCPVSIIPQMLHIYLYLDSTTMRKTNMWSLGTIKSSMFFRMPWTIGEKCSFSC